MNSRRSITSSVPRLVVTLLLTGSLLGCTSNRPAGEIIFPLNGATLHNPVTLQASQVEPWSIDGTRYPAALTWTGTLPAGTHTAQLGNSTLTFTVREDLPLGEIRTLTPDRDGLVELPEGTFDVLAMNFTNVKRSGLTLSAAAGQTSPPSTALTLSLTAPAQDQGAALHDRFRREAQRLLDRKVPKAHPLRAQNVAPAASTTLKVLNVLGSGNVNVQADLIYAHGRVNAYLHRDPVADAQVTERAQAVARSLDARLDRVVTATFGAFSDVDGSGRVTVLFTPLLNESRVAVGFFNPADLFARTDDNPDSNEQEILYLGVPEEEDLNFSAGSLMATACHEGTHLSTFAQKTLLHWDGEHGPMETVAVSEGLSHLAEDLCGYGTLGGNVAFVSAFLQAVPATSLDGMNLAGQTDTLARRGAMYLFLRQLFEQNPPVSCAGSVRQAAPAWRASLESRRRT